VFIHFEESDRRICEDCGDAAQLVRISSAPVGFVIHICSRCLRAFAVEMRRAARKFGAVAKRLDLNPKTAGSGNDKLSINQLRVATNGPINIEQSSSHEKSKNK